MVKKLIKLGVFLLIANALYQAGPVWIRHYQFRDALKEMALFSKATSDQAFLDQVMKLADDRNVPLTRDSVQVVVRREAITVDASYVQAIEVVPGYRYRWPFDITINVGRGASTGLK